MVIISEHKFTRFIFIMCKPLIFFNSSFAIGDVGKEVQLSFIGILLRHLLDKLKGY